MIALFQTYSTAGEGLILLIGEDSPPLTGLIHTGSCASFLLDSIANCSVLHDSDLKHNVTYVLVSSLELINRKENVRISRDITASRWTGSTTSLP